MATFFYRLVNTIVASVFAATMGFAIYTHAPGFWDQCNEAVPAACGCLGIVAVVVAGWGTLESRKF